MLRVARQYVTRQTTAEDLLQGTWAAVLRTTSTGSKVARRSRPGCCGSWSTPPAPVGTGSAQDGAGVRPARKREVVGRGAEHRPCCHR
ncbi:hypothetical protein ACVGVP_27520 [Pseudonocardia artemisiae]